MRLPSASEISEGMEVLMSRIPSSQAAAALEHLAEQFTHWRQSRSRRERIPNALWAQAVSLTSVLPVSRVAKRLRLGVNDLKKRRGSPPAAPLTFVEVTASGPPRPVGLEVEVQRPDGTQLRLSAPEATPALTALVQTFWAGRS
jgi:hypothetical protein